MYMLKGDIISAYNGMTTDQLSEADWFGVKILSTSPTMVSSFVCSLDIDVWNKSSVFFAASLHICQYRGKYNW